ncbi:glycogenin 1 isoform X1 [Lycorma delicatula]|uniref:glycogenin 1 isoform X1 n=1 Tax=Lycorma delicatula TaxID=130591 RepID=UPI003F511779
MGGFAWVTLATNDSYSLGALVLAHSLKRVNTAHQLAVMITPGVSEAMRTQLSAVFNVVKVVDVLDSQDQDNLALLSRPELGITFTKLHCWRLTQFDKCVFLDADTIVLQNSDELFEREELSAAPDIGWPDCFNSGVFVFKPSDLTYKTLIEFALVHGTFDGGDQGLLNLFFSDWATKDISKHLPFVYNVVSSAMYTYLPAFKQFQDRLKIIHFIGSSKPWLQPFDTETGVARVSSETQNQKTFIQLWWDLFCAYVHPTLTSNMSRQRLSTCYVFSTSTSPSSLSCSSDLPYNDPHPFLSTDISKQIGFWTLPPPQTSHSEEPYKFLDPWDELYDKNNGTDHISEINGYNIIHNLQKIVDNDSLYHNKTQNEFYYEEKTSDHIEDFSQNYMSSQQMCEKLDAFKYSERYDNHNCSSNVYDHNFNESNERIDDNQKNNYESHYINDNSVQRTNNHDYQLQSRQQLQSQQSHFMRQYDTNKQQQQHQTHNIPKYEQESSPTTHPLPDQKHFPPDTSSLTSHHEECTASFSNKDEAGLAGALSSIKLGTPLSEEETALQEHLRRQGWEEGNIDYMGRDSFDNIWKKICETLADVTPSYPSTTPSAVVSPATKSAATAPEPLPTQPSATVPLPSESTPTGLEGGGVMPPSSQPVPSPLESVSTAVTSSKPVTPPLESASIAPSSAESAANDAQSTEVLPPLLEPTSTPASLEQPQGKTSQTVSIPPVPETKLPESVPVSHPEQLKLESQSSEKLIKPTTTTQSSIQFTDPKQSSQPISAEQTTEVTATKPVSTIDEKPVEPVVPISSPKDQVSESMSSEPPKTDSKQSEATAKTIGTEEKPATAPQPFIPTDSPPALSNPVVTPSSAEAAIPPSNLEQSKATQEPVLPHAVQPPTPTPTEASPTPIEPPSLPVTVPSSTVPSTPQQQPSIVPASEERSVLTPPPSPEQPTPFLPSPQVVTPSTPTITAPTPPTSPPAVSQEPPLNVAKLKVQEEIPQTPPVTETGAPLSLPEATGDEPPVPPKRKGGKGGGGAGVAAQGEQVGKQQQSKGGKGGKGKK